VSRDPLETLREALSDRYRVERLLGSGGMATVYLAHDLKHDRPVAIKVLRPMLAAALGPERFLREIQIAAKLNHPHILALHDSGEADGLLYYVMPYVEGETLQGRIAREKQLPVADAVRIAGEVASALAYAHGHGVIHRDIKPGNILLSNGYALVADFGLARAISNAKTRSDASITHSGLTIGTPTYMSPEQSRGEAEIDGRSDLYALGCVLYELLVGDPPFSASTPSVLMARHASAKAVPIRALRPSVPAGIEWAVMRALEKLPADRYQKAEEFGEALRAGGEAAEAGGLPKWVAQGALLTIAAALLILLVRSITGGGDERSAIDTARYAVLEPVGLAAGDAVTRELAQLLQAALGRWRGVNVVDRFQVGDRTAREGDRPINPEDAGRLARDLGAGRYFRSEAVRSGDSLRLRLGFFEVGRPAAFGEEATVLRGDLVGADSVIAGTVDRLLLRGLGSGGPEAEVRGTTSLPALQAYARGQAAIQNWRLDQADSAFEESLGYDPEYASAALWLAHVRVWNSVPAVRWRPLAEYALAARTRLGEREGLLAGAIAAQARDDYPSACAIYRREKDRDPRRFVAWYGLATCLAYDNAVIPDGRSPSRWRFRTSYEEAVKAYQQAFAILPSMHVAFRADGFRRIQAILFTSSNGVRPGRAVPPDSASFLAYPSWRSDSLVFIPYPQSEFSRGLPQAREGKQEAVLQQRKRFHEIAVAWRGFFPNGADALEALALSLELLGDASALDTLRRARRAAKEPKEALRVAAGEIWLRLKLALPDDVRGLHTVRALADSLAGKSG